MPSMSDGVMQHLASRVMHATTLLIWLIVVECVLPDPTVAFNTLVRQISPFVYLHDGISSFACRFVGVD